METLVLNREGWSTSCSASSSQFTLDPSSHSNYALEDYTIVQLLAEGRTGCIFKVFGIHEKKEFVLKEAEASTFSQNEIQILSQLDHPHIIRFQAAWLSPLNNFLLMEIARGSDLCELVMQKKFCPEDESRSLFKQAVQAVAYLHSQNIAHRDIKLDNFLLMEPRSTLSSLRMATLKLADFEFSARFSENTFFTEPIGTFEYSSPEVRQGYYKGPDADVWSLGVVLFMLRTGHFPFPHSQLKAGKEKVFLHSDFSHDFKDLLLRILNPDSKERPSATQILGHSWLHDSSESQPEKVNKMRAFLNRRKGLTKKKDSPQSQPQSPRDPTFDSRLFSQPFLSSSQAQINFGNEINQNTVVKSQSSRSCSDIPENGSDIISPRQDITVKPRRRAGFSIFKGLIKDD
eukprot:TRINITY_DN1655_c0_g1_i1.p1 TRINITY_DN1655_c0_g1~~TRINITY_DN1655_c0_g1_i1.p1  ORF type:complete len:419 (+),score=84.82 TRINITY_DN1655_c0_g1_i1:53-1258(+)